MSSEFDIVIRGGTVHDGSGGPSREADVAISGSRIAAVGTVSGRGKREIDARGKIVTPGFVDIHTHFDGQATWASDLSPTSWHGVTTAVMGNCGVGFAPCRTEDHDRLVRLMEGVEDIPEVVLTEGLDWRWETFEEFLDAVDARPHDIDFAAQVPHSPLRVYVMGERGANREPATPEDIAAMAQLARRGIEAGAIGFSTSRTINHRTADGDHTPTFTAAEDELTGIAMGLKAAGQGVLQLISDFSNREEEFAMIRRIAEKSGRPLSFTLVQTDWASQDWQHLLDDIADAQSAGVNIRGQVCGRPIGLLLGLEISLNPFSAHEVYKEIADLPFEDRLAAFRNPDFKARLLAEKPQSDDPFMGHVLRNFDNMFPLGDPPNYEPLKEHTIGAQARARGMDPLALAYEMLLERDGHAMLYFPFVNYTDATLEPSLAMMRNPHTLLGLADGGAHLGMICDSSFHTTMLTHWTRDRTRGEQLPLEWVIKRMTRDNALAMGMADRGLVAAGMKADLNVIDHANLRLHAPEVRYDLPAGGKRLVQRADGYAHTIVSGAVTYENGEATGALPGRLVRGPQQGPAALAAE